MKIILKDSTLREGLDVPGVALKKEQKQAIVHRLAQAGIMEAEVVAPGHFERDIQIFENIERPETPIKYSGLLFAHGRDFSSRLKLAANHLDRFDILVPLSELRPPASRTEKSRELQEALNRALEGTNEVGVGFPHAFQAPQEWLFEMVSQATAGGARRITLFDTNGKAYPWDVRSLIEKVKTLSGAELCFHAHNDLGMATANAVTAVQAGASVLDVTVNGLGDRAGNASLEQVAVALYLQGFITGLKLDALPGLSSEIEAITGILKSRLAPVVGEFVFAHCSPKHLENPALFEAFDPALVGLKRTLCKT